MTDMTTRKGALGLGTEEATSGWEPEEGDFPYAASHPLADIPKEPIQDALERKAGLAWAASPLPTQ